MNAIGRADALGHVMVASPTADVMFCLACPAELSGLEAAAEVYGNLGFCRGRHMPNYWQFLWDVVAKREAP